MWANTLAPRTAAPVVGTAGERQHVFRDVGDLCLFSSLSCRSAASACRAPFWDVGADAMMMVCGCPRSCRPRANRRGGWDSRTKPCAPRPWQGAQLAERGPAAGQGKAQQVRIALDGLEVAGGDLVAKLRLGRLGCLDLLGDGGALAVAEHAPAVGRQRRPSRIGANSRSPRRCRRRRSEPPSRQRLVQLLDAVPLVAGGLDAVHASRRACGWSYAHRLLVAVRALSSGAARLLEARLVARPERVDQHGDEHGDEHQQRRTWVSGDCRRSWPAHLRFGPEASNVAKSTSVPSTCR